MSFRSNRVVDGMTGPASALAAYALWGVSSLYWHLLPSVPPEELLSYRVLLSCIVLLLVLLVTRTLKATIRAALTRRNLAIYSCSALSIATNWTVFMWGAVHGHVIETGVGYLIAPLINVAFGALVLRERLTPAKYAAVALMVTGLAFLISNGGDLTIWIYLTIGISFGAYSLFRKLGPLGAIQGLAVETSLLTVVVIAAFLFGGISLTLPLVSSPHQVTILAFGGVVSVVPLWLFSVANRALRLGTLGFFQYALPTTQFALAILYYGQLPSAVTIVSLAIIWSALAIVVLESAVARKGPRSQGTRDILAGGKS